MLGKNIIKTDKQILIWTLILFSLGALLPLSAQNEDIYIDPNKSDPTLRRDLIVSGNQVTTDITNYGTIAKGNDSDVASGGGGVWPRGTGHDHIHEMTGFIAARVRDNNGNYTYIISDGYRDPGGSGAEIDPVTNILYKFHPLPGYFNPEKGQDEIANSLNPNSWPASWPGKEASWDGKWNGYFGLNQFNATQEALYVMDDVYNKEFNFTPFQNDPSRGGLGVQIETRVFQWAHPLAKDILFIHFQVSNAGDYDYNYTVDSIFFGGYGDIGIGGRGTTDDDAAFSKEQDMVYGWDHDNIGVWNKFRDIPPGYIGWKFLESPGISDDGIDNDDDGLVDESRDNDAGMLVFGPIGKYGDPKEHWSGDEDGDWNPATDDVGRDGAGPLDEGYPGPDEGESNGRPDQGEPNFGKLDNDESDQVGLTSFTAPLFGTIAISDEQAMWQVIRPGYFTIPQQNVNQYWIFASGPFNLTSRKTERFSTCWVFGFDEKALFQTAEVSQRIYDADYRFAREPRMPVLKATAGDGKVILVWDDKAEQSRDPIYGYDFEGYRILKSTEPFFLEPGKITDARGNPVFSKPIAQFDLINGLVGPHPLQYGQEIGAPNGSHFYMGDDTGLQHYYIDTDVINGRTYYYMITAYDRGYDLDFYERGLADSPNLFPITPSESIGSITVVGGEVVRMDVNTAIATPNPMPSNLSEGNANVEKMLERTAGKSNGHITIDIVGSELLKDADYKVGFVSQTVDFPVTYETRSYHLINMTTGDTVLSQPVPINLNTGAYLTRWTQEILDEGFVLHFKNRYPDADSVALNAGWVPGSLCNMIVEVRPEDPVRPVLEPISFVIEFGDANSVLDTAYLSKTGTRKSPANFKVYDYDTGAKLEFMIYERVRNDTVRINSDNEGISLLFKKTPDASRFSGSWLVTFKAPLDENGLPLPDSLWIFPQAGDQFLVKNSIPFSSNDAYEFKTFQQKINQQVEDNILKKIRVVPNPYVASSILEGQPFQRGRGERFIRFINTPANCTIRIFTVNGDLVKTLHSENPMDGFIRWDLTTKDNLEVAFGLYIYHVEAPGIGEHIGKFAIIN